MPSARTVRCLPGVLRFSVICGTPGVFVRRSAVWRVREGRGKGEEQAGRGGRITRRARCEAGPLRSDLVNQIIKLCQNPSDCTPKSEGMHDRPLVRSTGQLKVQVATHVEYSRPVRRSRISCNTFKNGRFQDIDSQIRQSGSTVWPNSPAHHKAPNARSTAGVCAIVRPGSGRGRQARPPDTAPSAWCESARRGLVRPTRARPPACRRSASRRWRRRRRTAGRTPRSPTVPSLPRGWRAARSRGGGRRSCRRGG